MNVALAWADLSDPTDRSILLNLSRELSRRGHRIRLVGPRRGFGDAALELVDGFPVHRVGPSHDAAVEQLLRIHRDNAIAVWHCHVFGRDHGAFAAASRKAAWPMIATLHLVLEDYAKFLGGIDGLRRLLQPARRIVAVAEAQRREFIRAFPGWRSRSGVIGYGAPEKRTSGAAASPARRPFLLCAARLAPYKGQDVLLMAFAKARDLGLAADLVLCGRDQTKGALPAFIRTLGLSGRVRWLGEVSPSRLRGLLSSCKFLVLPSRRDNLPLIAIEALAAGKAVVASAVGGVPDIVRHGREGLLVPPNEADALARAMVRLAGDDELRSSCERSALKRSANFRWDVVARSYERLYSSAAVPSLGRAAGRPPRAGAPA